jgi:putative redox protein
VTPGVWQKNASKLKMGKTKILGYAIAENSGAIYKTSVTSGNDVFIVDEPKDFGGNEEGPAPVDYLCMALASCKAVTIRMYVKRKGWNLDNVHVKVTFVKGDQMEPGKNTFFCVVRLAGDLSDEQLKRILEISKVCPVDRLLNKPSDVVIIIE